MKNQFFIKYYLALFICVLSVSIAGAQKIYINSGTRLVMNSNVSLVVMNGAVINKGTIVPGSSSSVYFRGTDSAHLQGTSAIDLNNLYLDQSTTLPLTLNVPVNVTGTVSLVTGSAIINTNDQLTLKSTEFNTARVAAIPTGGNISGKVTVESFIGAHRGYRLIGVPLNSTGAPTIKASWQENATSATDNPYPGYGTHITGVTSPSNGFDVNPTHSVSCKQYVGGLWSGIPNTDVQKITDRPGYILFVRGSRANNLSLGVNSPADNTVLRAKGNLNIGDVQSTVAASGYTLVNNPYASAIDFASVTRSAHVRNTFYVWDPLLTGSKGVGGYVTVSYNGIDYDVTGSVSAIDQNIQPGAAFFVKSDGTAGTITIKETDKSNPIHLNGRPAGGQSKLWVELLVENADSSLTLYDGVLAGFNDVYSADIDDYDAIKISSGGESLGIFSDGQELSIERRPLPQANQNDTVFFRISGMTIKKYHINFASIGMNFPNYTGFVEDTYTGTQTTINLVGITDIAFNVTADPASAAANRFRLVLRYNPVLATVFTSLNATGLNKDVVLNWHIADATGIRYFEIQRSSDGNSYTTIGTVSSTGNTTGQYRWTDITPGDGKFYYRVRSVSFSGELKYSPMVNIKIGQNEKGILINPNMIIDNSISLQLKQQSEGIYSVQLKNAMGQILLKKKIQHTGGSTSEVLTIGQSISTGIYFMEVVTPDNNKLTFKLLKQ